MTDDPRRRATSPFRRLLALAAAGVGAGLAAPAGAGAQDAHIMAPADSVERRLRHEVIEILDERGSRFEGDRTSRVVLTFPDGELMAVKWAPAPWRGDDFNNSPRYEAAAYEIQKLFLDEPEYVVPPTVLRAVPVAWYRRLAENARPTFPNTESVLVALQYWLFNVTGGEVWDEDRFARDTLYARHVANLNTLTFLIRHNDANEGNFLISRTAENPRVFSVDNGLSFSSEASDRGTDWRRLRVGRIPARTVERLRSLTEAELVRRLETVAQFVVRPDAQLAPMSPTANLKPDQGVRHEDGLIQLGLTRSEIRGVWRRVERLLADVDEGKVGIF